MKLKKFEMEEWFIRNENAKYNFSESGTPDFNLEEFLKTCNEDISRISKISLGNNNTRGSLRLRKKISKLYNNIPEEEIITTTGTSEALYIFFRLFLKEGSTVMTISPTFPILYLLPQSLNSEVHFIDATKLKSKEELIVETINQIKKKSPDLFILNLPNNPLGFSLNKSQIIRIIKTCKETKTTILFDEHYRLLEDELPESGYNITKEFYDKVFTVGSPIKCFGIVGSRLGWLIGNKKFISEIREYKDYTTHCVSLLTEEIINIALENRKTLASKFLPTIKDNYDKLVKSNLVEIPYEWDSGCVTFLKLKKENSIEITKKLYEKFSISVMPGESFNKKGFIRINLSQPKEKFDYFLESLQNSIID